VKEWIDEKGDKLKQKYTLNDLKKELSLFDKLSNNHLNTILTLI